jgi:hypothetical protein
VGESGNELRVGKRGMSEEGRNKGGKKGKG